MRTISDEVYEAYTKLCSATGRMKDALRIIYGTQRFLDAKNSNGEKLFLLGYDMLDYVLAKAKEDFNTAYKDYEAARTQGLTAFSKMTESMKWTYPNEETAFNRPVHKAILEISAEIK